MNIEIATFVDKMQAMLNGLIALLPNLILALIIFAIFFFVARTIKKVVRNLTHRRQARNLGMVLGRLAQGTTIFDRFIYLTVDRDSFSQSQ